LARLSKMNQSSALQLPVVSLDESESEPNESERKQGGPSP
jgi:hypothetical protein